MIIPQVVLDRIDGLIIIGKFFARPVRAYDRQRVAAFDQRMKQYVKANFAVEDSNELLAETLLKANPVWSGSSPTKIHRLRTITGKMNILGWSLPRMFTLMVIGQNIIKFGGLILAVAGLFILIGLNLAAPVLSVFGFDEKFAAQVFYPFCWEATFALVFPIVKEMTLYVCFGIGLLAGIEYYGR